MTKTMRNNIRIIYGSEYAIISAHTSSDMKTLINIIRDIVDASTAVSTVATIMECMTGIIRGKSDVCDSETGTDESTIFVHVDTKAIVITFTGFQVKSENL